MKKKIVWFGFVIIFLLAFTNLSAMAADVKIGGWVTLDFYYFDQDSARQAGGIAKGAVAPGNGSERTVIEIPWGRNRLNFTYSNDDKRVGAFIEFRDGFNAGREQQRNFALAYLWWQVNPMVKFQFGRMSQIVSPFTPRTTIGSGIGGGSKKYYGGDFGNLHHGTTFDQMRVYFKFSDMLQLQMSIVDPDTHDYSTADPLPAALGGNAENEIPRIDVAAPINFGAVNLVPSFTYFKRHYDEVTPGNDDSVTIWAVSLATKASFGPVTIAGELQGGQNLGRTVSTCWGVGACDPQTYGPAGSVKIADSDYTGYWIDLGYKLGKVTFHGILGGQQTDNDGDPGIPQDAAEFDVTRKMYGVTLPISVAKGFTIQPELMFYDFGNDNEYAGVETDDGEERVFGVQFELKF